MTTTFPLHNLFVADERRHRVVDLPVIGHVEVSGLDGLAAEDSTTKRYDEGSTRPVPGASRSQFDAGGLGADAAGAWT